MKRPALSWFSCLTSLLGVMRRWLQPETSRWNSPLKKVSFDVRFTYIILSFDSLGASRLLCGILYRVFRLAYKIRECNEEFYSVAWHSKNFSIVIPLDTINVINLV